MSEDERIADLVRFIAWLAQRNVTLCTRHRRPSTAVTGSWIWSHKWEPVDTAAWIAAYVRTQEPTP